MEKLWEIAMFSLLIMISANYIRLTKKVFLTASFTLQGSPRYPSCMRTCPVPSGFSIVSGHKDGPSKQNEPRVYGNGSITKHLDA